MCTSKGQKKTLESYDDIWLYLTAHNHWKGSKAGLWSIRANNLKLIDERNKETHKQLMKLRKDCFKVQESVFLKWLTFATVMLTVVQPVTCILKADWYHDLEYSIVMIPSSLCWLGLVVSITMSTVKVHKYHRLTLKLMDDKPKVTGHNFQLPTKLRFTDLSNNIVLASQIFLLIGYLAVIIKVYVTMLNLTYLDLQPLLYAPFLLAYTYQLIIEVHQTRIKGNPIKDNKEIAR